MLRYLLKQSRNRLTLFDDRIELDFMGEEQAVVRWTELTRAGLATTARRRSIFLYRADQDQLVELSDEFESFEAILSAVRARTDFEELDLGGPPQRGRSPAGGSRRRSGRRGSRRARARPRDLVPDQTAANSRSTAFAIASPPAMLR